jgi:hypothetical protein
MKQGIVTQGADTSRAWLVGVLVIASVALSGCASGPSSDTSASAADQHRVVTVQCTATGTNVDTPCVEEARQTCASEARLKDVPSKTVIPTTQGVDQASMSLTQYVARYACQ